MKLLAFSDTHGLDLCVPGSLFWEGVPNGGIDVVCIAGDIMPLEYQSNHAFGSEWLKEEFFEQIDMVLKKCGAKICLLTPGNHDFIFETEFLPEFPDYIKVLIDEEYMLDMDGLDSYRFYGTPWCNMTTRYKWAFDIKDEELLNAKFEGIPSDIDVFITHCPPACTPAAQQIKQPYLRHGLGDFVDYGSVSLKERIDLGDIDPSILLCGHIHEHLADKFMYNSIGIYNVSVKNESYVAYKAPVIIEL